MQIVGLIISLVVATTLADECPGAVGSNWVVGTGRCYTYVSRSLSWKDAQEHCSTLGFAGSLVFLDSEEASAGARRAVQNIVGVDAPDMLWVGITDEGSEGEWKSVDGVTIALDQMKFLDNEPNNAGGNENYLQIHGGEWKLNDRNGAFKSQFICQVEPAQLDELQCPRHWQQRGNVCYKYIDSPMNWDDAQERCSIMGNEGSLVDVPSKEVNDFIFELTGTDNEYWIGLMDRCHENEWSDAFGQRRAYFNWLPSQPDDMNGEDCAHVWGDTRKWNDDSCEVLKTFVCQRSAFYSTSNCPTGFVQRGRNCYRYVNERGSYRDAMATCQEQAPGASLPAVRSEVDYNEVYEAAAASAGGECADNFKNFWTGASYPTEFDGNVNQETPVVNMFGSSLTARFVRVQPTAWHSHISMRMELLTDCSADYGENILGLGMEDRNIPDYQISASSEFDVNHGPGNARLNRHAQGRTTGAWSAKSNDLDQWIQADLGCIKQVAGMVTQGRNGYGQWVTKYNVQYSVDGESWSFVEESGANAEFSGNSDQETQVANMFKSPVKAQFIRLLPTAWFNHISLRFDVLGFAACQDGSRCREGLGMENRLISDDQITASTIWDGNHGPGNARLNRPKQGSTTGGWSAKVRDSNQWIQADLGDAQSVSGVITQGRNAYAQWVTKYNVQYSTDGESWTYVQNANGEKVEFNGNSDTDTPVANMFKPAVNAQFIRILPTSFYGHISMRFEILGDTECSVEIASKIAPLCYNFGLGMENKRISDDDITASTIWDENHGPSNARLNRPKQGSTTGGWSAKDIDLNQWIQADLGDLQSVSGVVTQGRNAYAQWVTKYNVQYSDDGESWSFVQDNGANVEFNGNSDTDTPVKNMFASQLRARFIRIRPTAWHGHISMRFEVLGCDGNEKDSCPLGLADRRIRDDQITAATTWHFSYGPANARLFRGKSTTTTGAWSAAANNGDQWLQVDFGSSRVITGVVTQGRSKTDVYQQWVTKYFVMYSDDGESWSYLEDSNGGKAVGQLMVKGEKKMDFESGSADAFVCQVPARITEECICPIVDCPQCPIPEPCPVPITVPSCPVEGWTLFDGACYQFHGKKSKWSDAKGACEKAGGYLASRMTKSEFDFVGDLIATSVGGTKGKKKKVFAWIGLSDQTTEGEFTWVDGGAYDGGLKIVQKKDKEGSDCALFKKGQLTHSKCNAKQAFVCKMDIFTISLFK